MSIQRAHWPLVILRQCLFDDVAALLRILRKGLANAAHSFRGRLPMREVRSLRPRQPDSLSLSLCSCEGRASQNIIAPMATIASKVLADLRKPSRGNVVDLATFRSAKEEVETAPELAEGLAELDQDLGGTPPEFQFWMGAFRHLMGMGYGLLGSRHLRKLAERIDETDERYMPGGPPMSPLTDSFHSLWSVADLSLGLKKESLATVSIAVARALGMPKEPLSAWQSIADSYAGVYRITKREEDVVILEELVTGERRDVVLVDPVPAGPGHLWWVRLLPPVLPEHNYWTTIGTPYVFSRKDAEKLWLDYFERQLASLTETKRAGGYRRLMKQGSSPDAWFEFILDAYAGEKGPAVLLQGVPDLAETLPHSLQHDDLEKEESDSPLHRLRLELLRVAAQMGLSDMAEDDFLDACDSLELPKLEIEDWHEPARILFYAYLMFECRDQSGRRALDEIDREALDLEERAELKALEAGWFSLFEVLRIKVDEAFEVRDVVRRRRFWITECSATRSLEVGDCVACWITKDGEQTFMEGAVAHVPRVWSPAAIDMLREIVDSMRHRHPSMHWRERQGQLVPWMGAIMALIMSRRPPVNLVNYDGDAILQSQAHYSLKDRSRVLALLRGTSKLRETSPGTFECLHENGDVLVGQILVEDRELCITTNSSERLATLREWLEEIAETLVQHRGTSYQDPLSAKQDMKTEGSFAEVEQIPPELREQIAGIMRAKLAEMLDTKVPLLGNKTPREAVRSAKGRDDVTSWLLGQERLNAANPQMSDLLDTSFMWEELDLVHPDKRV